MREFLVMFRFYYVIIISIPLIIYYGLKATYYYNHQEQFDDYQCYKLAQNIIRSLQKRARIRTIGYGVENLPKDSGYIMYANHQGKYDALGIMSVHKEPCSVIMDAERSRVIFANQFVNLVRGIRLERNNFKQQVHELGKLVEKAKKGKRFIYFPEGKYEHNGNKLQDFRPGSFKCSKLAECPIVPVAIYDSHLPFDFNSLRKATTQVYFLEPIFFSEYAEKTTKEISIMVKERIEEKIQFLEENRRRLNLNSHFKIYKQQM